MYIAVTRLFMLESASMGPGNVSVASAVRAVLRECVVLCFLGLPSEIMAGLRLGLARYRKQLLACRLGFLSVPECGARMALQVFVHLE